MIGKGNVGVSEGLFEEVTFNLELKELGVRWDKAWQERTKERDLGLGFGSKKMLDEFEKLREGQHPKTLKLAGPRHKWGPLDETEAAATETGPQALISNVVSSPGQERPWYFHENS